MDSLVDGYLSHIMDECHSDRSGHVADYIPELAAVDPEGYGLSMCVHDGHTYSHRDSATAFTIQSVSKPLTYAMVLKKHGTAAVDAKIASSSSIESKRSVGRTCPTKSTATRSP